MNALTMLYVVLLVGITSTAQARSFNATNNTRSSRREALQAAAITACKYDADCNHGYCRNLNATASVCQCFHNWIDREGQGVCTYKQTSKSKAFLLSFFVGALGVDWFVLAKGNPGYIGAGVCKLLLSLLNWILPCCGVCSDAASYLVPMTLNLVSTLGALVWWLVDWIRILNDAFPDGHHLPLASW